MAPDFGSATTLSFTNFQIVSFSDRQSCGGPDTHCFCWKLDPHERKKLDPVQHVKMKSWIRICIKSEKLDPDLQYSDKMDPDPRESEKLDPDSH
jgi:hypothetical protein